MSFDVAIHNVGCYDGNVVNNSVKAAYLYADKVRIYDYFSAPKILDELSEQWKEECYKDYKKAKVVLEQIKEKYPLLKKWALEQREDVPITTDDLFDLLDADKKIRLYNNLDFLYDYDIFITATQRLRKETNEQYDTETHKKDLVRLGVDWFEPKLDNCNLESVIERVQDFNDSYHNDAGFKLLNSTLDYINGGLPSSLMLTPSYLSDYAISSLPGFDEATVDEIIDIKKELDKYIIPYRSSILKMANSIKEIPDTESLHRECAVLYLQEIEPRVKEINTAVRDNNVFKNILKSIVNEKDAWVIGASAMVAGISTTGSIANAVSASTIAALGGLSIANGITKTIEEKKNIQNKEMYFLYESGKKMEEQQQKKKDLYMYYN